MALLATQDVVYAGLLPTYAAATGGGDTFVADQDTILHAKNGSGGALTVTVAVAATSVGGQAITSIAVSVPAGSERMIGPFPPNFFNSPSTGVASITYSGVTSLTVAIIRARAPSGA
jgi:hypothetical protein